MSVWVLTIHNGWESAVEVIGVFENVDDATREGEVQLRELDEAIPEDWLPKWEDYFYSMMLETPDEQSFAYIEKFQVQ